VRIGLITESNLNANYRTLIPLRALERRGHEVVWPSSAETDAPMRDLLSCDVVHCYRRLDRFEDLRRLSQRGVAIVFDNDDNHAAAEVSEGGAGAAGARYNRKVFRDVLKAARLADVTTTPSRELAHVYRAAGVERVAVLENHLPREMFGFGSRSRHDGVVVGWVAGREHRIELERLPVRDTFARLLQAHPKLRVLTVGLRVPLDSPRYEHVSKVLFGDLLTTIAGIDVAVAPLADTPFNRCRSNVKLKEYGSAGAAWLASPVGAYRELGERQGGRLVADDGWFEALQELVGSSRRRRRLARRALAWAKAETIDRHAAGWEDAFSAAVERAQARIAERGRVTA
jgi:glycosyltransferase involved in cell wall biosynthesis